MTIREEPMARLNQRLTRRSRDCLYSNVTINSCSKNRYNVISTKTAFVAVEKRKDAMEGEMELHVMKRVTGNAPGGISSLVDLYQALPMKSIALLDSLFDYCALPSSTTALPVSMIIVTRYL
jgi:hypothetical protein